MASHRERGLQRDGVQLLLSLLLFGLAACGGDEVRAPDDPSVGGAGWLRVAGSHIVDDRGETVVLRGLALADPEQLLSDGHWDADHFAQAAGWGACVVRIPIHPRFWRDRGAEDYLALLDQGVEWAKQNNLFVVLDWHSIGDLYAEAYDPSWDGVYLTTRAETLDFWRRVAARYANEPRVAFYEIFNEPTQYVGDRYTGTSWSRWRPLADEIVGEIRRYSPHAIAIVGGLDWAHDLRPVAADPVRQTGIVYAVHPYPNKRPEPWESYWAEDFGALCSRYPVFATEFGFETSTQAPGGSVALATVDYGERIVRFMEARGISWTVWCFHPSWPPTLLAARSHTPTRPAGEFFRSVLLRESPGG